MVGLEPNGEYARTAMSAPMTVMARAAPTRTPSSLRASSLAYVRVGMAVAIPAALREWQVAPEAVFAAAGLEETAFDDPDRLIQLSVLDRLMGACLKATRCEHFGLSVGRSCGPSALGAAGCLGLHSPTVGVALDNLVRHFHHHGRDAAPSLGLRDDVAILGLHLPGAVHADQFADGAMAAAFNLMRTLCGPNWQPSEILLRRRVPADPAPFRQFFGPDVRFNQERLAIVFSAHWLHKPVEGADPVLRRILEQRVAAMEAETPFSLSDSLRGCLRSMLLKENCSIETVARQLELHPRALSRRLAQEHTTYRALVDEVRYEIARQLLSLTTLTAGEISSVLDFCDGAAFTRAFKRWSGWTPSAWRAASATMARP